jgi:hypothetical protein
MERPPSRYVSTEPAWEESPPPGPRVVYMAPPTEETDRDPLPF